VLGEIVSNGLNGVWEDARDKIETLNRAMSVLSQEQDALSAGLSMQVSQKEVNQTESQT